MTQLLLQVLRLSHQELLLLSQVLAVLLFLVVEVQFVRVVHLCSFLVDSFLDGVPQSVLGLDEQVLSDLLLVKEAVLVSSVLSPEVIDSLLVLCFNPSSAVLECG